MEVSNSSASHARMAAVIRCHFHLSRTEMDAMMDDEDEFLKTWCEVKYYLEVVNQVKFS